MSRTFAEYTSEEKIQVLMASELSKSSQLRDAHEDLLLVSGLLGQALRLLDAVDKGKPYKRAYKRFIKELKEN